MSLLTIFSFQEKFSNSLEFRLYISILDKNMPRKSCGLLEYLSLRYSNSFNIIDVCW